MRWTTTLFKFRWLVIAFWLAMAVLGALAAPKLVNDLSYSLALPKQPAYETNLDIADSHRGGGAYHPLVVVYQGKPNSQNVFQQTSASLSGIFTGMGARVADQSTTSARMFDPDTGTGYLLAYFPPIPGPEPYVAALPQVEGVLQQAEGRASGAKLSVITADQLSETSIEAADRPVIVEILFGALGALIVLVVVFRSVLAFVPLLTAAVAITTAFLSTYGLTKVTDVSFIVQYLIGLIGLGVAIDYALLIVMRWREERRRLGNRDAVVEALRTAGHAVVFSGVTVAISLTSLLALPVPFLRSVGFTGLLIPLLSVAVAMTLLPLILDGVGPRLDRLGWAGSASPDSAVWRGIGGFVVRHRAIVAIASTGLLILCALPAFGMRLGTAEASGEGRDQQLASTWGALQRSDLGHGMLRPTELLVNRNDTASVAAQVKEIPGVADVITSRTVGWVNGEQQVIDVVTRHDPATTAGSRAVEQVERLSTGSPGFRMGGSPAQDSAFIEAIYGNVWIIITLICVFTFLLLAWALRSIWLPVKALLLNVLSVAAAYGITVWIWQEGNGTEFLFGLPATGTIPNWVPIAVFAFLFGLSMDYEVFLLSRIREEYLASGSTKSATVAGLSYTGRLVTSGALILFFSFVALATVPVVDVKILATALAVGILLDATIVRALLAPALVALFDAANWWFPFGRSHPQEPPGPARPLASVTAGTGPEPSLVRPAADPGAPMR